MLQEQGLVAGHAYSVLAAREVPGPGPGPAPARPRPAPAQQLLCRSEQCAYGAASVPG